MKNLVRRETHWVCVKQSIISMFDEEYTIYSEYEDDPLDMLPTREKIRPKDTWKRYNRDYDEHIIRAQNIIRNSEGLHISELRGKVKDALRWTRAYQIRDSIDSFITSNLHTYEMENGKRYWKDMDGRYTTPSRWWYDWTYEDVDGYMKKLKIPRNRKPRVDRRKYYEMTTLSRKRNKQLRLDLSRISELYLRFINYPHVISYMNSIRREYNYLNDIETESKSPYPIRSKNMTDAWWKWELNNWRRTTKAFTFERRRRRDQIRAQLDEIMSGDMSSYYNSREYRWSIQKECHHFAQP